MDNILAFEGVSLIEIQGDKVFHFEALYDSHASYQLIGFESPKIIVNDYRKLGKEALGCFFCTGDGNKFYDSFCTPAKVKVYKSKTKNEITVELSDTKRKTSRRQLWIAIGYRNQLPAFDYILVEDTDITKTKCGLFAIYKKPKNN